MTIPTQMSLAGFIASTPQLNFTGSGVARLYARVGVEHARKEPDGVHATRPDLPRPGAVPDQRGTRVRPVPQGRLLPRGRSIASCSRILVSMAGRCASASAPDRDPTKQPDGHRGPTAFVANRWGAATPSSYVRTAGKALTWAFWWS